MTKNIGLLLPATRIIIYYYYYYFITIIVLIVTKTIIIITTVNGERAYPQGCLHKDPTYYSYDTMIYPPNNVIIKTINDYLITRRLGTGKFSDVFEAVDINREKSYNVNRNIVDPRTLVVIKCLKPVSERKIHREVLILQRCSHLLNLARLEAIVLKEKDTMPAFVLEHAGMNSQWLCHGINNDEYLSDYEIRYYLFHLLIALDGLHSIGIMHRDVKPRNVLVNRRNNNEASTLDGSTTLTTPLMLIDLGLADFYIPGVNYNVRVASRHYKSPELLTGFELYDYSIDMWGVGCIVAGLLLHREPFFRGKDNLDQLIKIIDVLGIHDLITFINKYNIEISSEVENIIVQAMMMTQQSSNKNSKNNSNKNKNYHNKRKVLLDCRAPDCPIPDDIAMDLLEQLLVYDPDYRLTAQQAMQHPFFDPVREQIQSEIRSIITSTTSTSSIR